MRVVAREDVAWNRSIFKAPLLVVQPNFFALETVMESLGPMLTTDR